MSYEISDACTNCGSCDKECPVEAIQEKKTKRIINAEECIECGACEAICPAEAISLSE